jgi:hypothetical protein
MIRIVLPVFALFLSLVLLPAQPGRVRPRARRTALGAAGLRRRQGFAHLELDPRSDTFGDASGIEGATQRAA